MTTLDAAIYRLLRALAGTDPAALADAENALQDVLDELLDFGRGPCNQK